MGADEVGTLKGPTEHRVILGGSLGSQGPHGEHGGLQSTRAAKFIGWPKGQLRRRTQTVLFAQDNTQRSSAKKRKSGERSMIARNKTSFVTTVLAGSMFAWVAGAATADALEGKVLGGGQPITNSTVTLWAASEDGPQQLGQARTGADGGFTLSSTAPASAATHYLIAKGGQSQANAQGGDNPAIVLMTVVGGNLPATVTINEMTTVASVWTHALFLDGSVIKGPSLSLRIAASNVPNFVDLQTGG